MIKKSGPSGDEMVARDKDESRGFTLPLLSDSLEWTQSITDESIASFTTTSTPANGRPEPRRSWSRSRERDRDRDRDRYRDREKDRDIDRVRDRDMDRDRDRDRDSYHNGNSSSSNYRHSTNRNRSTSSSGSNRSYRSIENRRGSNNTTATAAVYANPSRHVQVTVGSSLEQHKKKGKKGKEDVDKMARDTKAFCFSISFSFH